MSIAQAKDGRRAESTSPARGRKDSTDSSREKDPASEKKKQKSSVSAKTKEGGSGLVADADNVVPASAQKEAKPKKSKRKDSIEPPVEETPRKTSREGSDTRAKAESSERRHRSEKKDPKEKKSKDRRASAP